MNKQLYKTSSGSPNQNYQIHVQILSKKYSNTVSKYFDQMYLEYVFEYFYSSTLQDC